MTARSWSAEADFIARLSDWDESADANWPFLRAERAALVTLNVPHFVLPSDGNEIRDAAGIGARSASPSGLDRARARVRELRCAGNRVAIRGDPGQCRAGQSLRRKPREISERAPIFRWLRRRAIFVPEADRIAAELSAARHSPRRRRRLDRSRLARRRRSPISSSVSGPISITASPGSACSSPRMHRSPDTRRPPSLRSPASPICAEG